MLLYFWFYIYNQTQYIKNNNEFFYLRTMKKE